MISIIIPFCNEMPQVFFTAQSLYEQLEGHYEYEIIAVDNRSDDKTKTVNDNRSSPDAKNNYFAHGYEKETFGCYQKPWNHETKQRTAFRDSFLNGRVKRFIYDDKLSHWCAKNYGIMRSEGDLILFLDAHCILSRDAIKSVVEFLEQSGETDIAHTLINYMLDSRSLEYAMAPEAFCYRFCTAQSQSAPYKVPIMSTCGMIIRRTLLDKLGMWNPELGIYGGGEAYIGYKMGTCGCTHWIVPSAKCWHYAQDRGYSWNLMDWVRNNLIAAYCVGGEEWLNNMKNYLKQKNQIPNLLPQIAANVVLSCQKDRKFIEQHQVMSYNDYVKQWSK